MAKDAFEIRLPNFKKIKNPWAVSTIIFGVVAVAAIIILAVNYFSGNFQGFCSIQANSNPQQTGQNIVNILNTQTNSTVQLENVTSFSGIYEIDVLYQNQTLPIYSTQDGKYLIQGVFPVQ